MPEQPPTSIVVIHGVGNQSEGETARDLSRALARSLHPDAEWPPPMLVTKTADVRCDARDGSEAETFTVAAYEIAALGSEPGRVARRFPVYDFYWANLSRGGTGFIAELKQSWQCVVGLPRIGYQALTHPAGNRFSRAILALMRPIYCIAWVLIVVRLLVSLLLILVMGRMTEDQIRNTWLRYYDVVFLIDLATAALILLFSTLRAVLWAAEREASHASHAAGLTLAITLLVTQALPLTILEFTGFDQRVYRLRTWFDISPGGGDIYRIMVRLGSTTSTRCPASFPTSTMA